MFPHWFLTAFKYICIVIFCIWRQFFFWQFRKLLQKNTRKLLRNPLNTHKTLTEVKIDILLQVIIWLMFQYIMLTISAHQLIGKLKRTLNEERYAVRRLKPINKQDKFVEAVTSASTAIWSAWGTELIDIHDINCPERNMLNLCYSYDYSL
jgi:hypothetical protein